MPLSQDDMDTLIDLRQKGVSYRKCVKEIGGTSEQQLRSAWWRYCQQNSTDWIQEERLAFLDIEAGGLEANSSYMLSWVLKPRKGEPQHAIITKKEIMSGELDRRIVQTLLKALQKVDVVVTYYGTGYDLPYIRTRSMMHGLEFPAFGTLKHYDVYYTVKSKLRLHRNRQEVACDTLGIEGKDHVQMALWQKAKLGDPVALAEVLSHNLRDVLTLEALFERMRPHARILRKSV